MTYNDEQELAVALMAEELDKAGTSEGKYRSAMLAYLVGDREPLALLLAGDSQLASEFTGFVDSEIIASFWRIVRPGSLMEAYAFLDFLQLNERSWPEEGKRNLERFLRTQQNFLFGHKSFYVNWQEENYFKQVAKRLSAEAR